MAISSLTVKAIVTRLGVVIGAAEFSFACGGSEAQVSSSQGGTGAGGQGANGGTVAVGGAFTDAGAQGGFGDASTSVSVTPVAAAVTHACAIRNGAVYCWGENQYGQLGNGTTAGSPLPVPVQGLSAGVQAVAAGSRISCALADANVRCWGDWGGANSQSGSSTPLRVQGLSEDVEFIIASVNACWALVGGGVYGWDGTFTAVQDPELDSGVQGISSGACVIKNHAAYCEGSNDYGQRGDGTANGQVTPQLVQVLGLTSGVTAIASGWYHVCAIANGDVYCWGDNLFGQLGHKPGFEVDNTCIVGIPAPGAPCGMKPVKVQGLPSGVSAITAGTYHSCAIANGLAYCWGANGFGELGDGTTTTNYQPVQVQGLTNVTAISAGAYPDSDGYDITCAVAGGDVYCWGANAYGQLGDGTTTDSAIPVKVQFP